MVRKVGAIMNYIEEISQKMQRGKGNDVCTLITQALEEGVSARKILDEGLLAGMSIIGDLFKRDEIFIPEVLVAARAMNMGVEVLKPYLTDQDASYRGTAVIGTVKGDLHDIGKNLVKMMMEGKGIHVIDLGVDVSAEQFLNAAEENNAQIVCCSALLTTTMDEMSEVVKLKQAKGMNIKIMIGGAPTSQDFAEAIGADAYTPDAASAAEVALGFCTA